MSIAGGLSNAVRRGVAAECDVVQIFVKNQLRWAGRRLNEGEVLETPKRDDGDARNLASLRRLRRGPHPPR